MARDPLKVLARVRAAAVTESRRALAAALAAEAAAEQHEQMLATRLKEEAAGASYEDAIAFAGWLPRAFHDRVMAQDATRQATLSVAEARAAAAARWAEAEAVSTLLAEQERAAAIERARREQAVLDEAGARRFGTAL